MRWRYRLCIPVLLLLVTACGPSSFNTPNAKGYYASSAVQCVPYAREVSGVQIRGDADGWWYSARGRYQRGYSPIPGAVLVLKATSRMPHGHVAVVKTILGPRLIDVTHSNWGSNSSDRRIIYESMRAEDVSATNNWSLIRFWNHGENVMGRPYPAYGFIYP